MDRFTISSNGVNTIVRGESPMGATALVNRAELSGGTLFANGSAVSGNTQVYAGDTLEYRQHSSEDGGILVKVEQLGGNTDLETHFSPSATVEALFNELGVRKGDRTLYADGAEVTSLQSQLGELAIDDQLTLSLVHKTKGGHR